MKTAYQSYTAAQRLQSLKYLGSVTVQPVHQKLQHTQLKSSERVGQNNRAKQNSVKVQADRLQRFSQQGVESKSLNVESVASYEGADYLQVLRTQKVDQNELQQTVQGWSNQIFNAACELSQQGQKYKDQQTEISLCLCDNKYISKLNKQYRNKDEPTDVLSFPMDADDGLTNDETYQIEDLEEAFKNSGDSEFLQETQLMESSEQLQDQNRNLNLLGDVVISLEQALEQAKERGHSLEQEIQVLLVHGILHLIGYDHEKGQKEHDEQMDMENKIFSMLNWPQKGLVTTSQQDKLKKDKDNLLKLFQLKAVVSRPPDIKMNKTSWDLTRQKIKLIAIDLDGTLLNTSSQVLDSTVDCIKRALNKGIRVIIATGKARTSAFGVLKKVGLAGKGLVVDYDGPGIYINGAASYDKGGKLIPSESIPRQLTEFCFNYSEEHQISLVSFEGDCLTTQKMTPENLRVHTFYHEPKPIVKPIPKILSGDPSKKLLFTGDPVVFKTQLRPDVKKYTRLYNAVIVQPMPHMLEVLTKGQSKWRGARPILKSLGLQPDNMMMFGDGENDIELIKNCGLGIAMGNGQDEVQEAADYVTATNDEHGIALAFEKFIL